MKSTRIPVETSGTLDLKIARYKRLLNILQKQRVLSSAYPDHKAKLTHKILAVRSRLQQLLQGHDVGVEE